MVSAWRVVGSMLLVVAALCGSAIGARASAINVIMSSEGVALCGDTGVYNSRGEITAFASKIFVLPLARAIVGFAGGVYFAPGLASSTMEARNGADAVAAVKDVVAYVAQLAKTDPKISRRKTTFYVAEFRAGATLPTAWKIESPEGLPGTVTVDTIEPGRVELLPALAASEIARFRGSPEDFCRHVLEAQRANTYEIPGWNDGKPAHIVGGSALYAVVKRDGTTAAKVLTRWPDTIGFRIDPNWKEKP
jgi:hypothetical protein